ncbi:MAG TPA: hypothetical protein VMG40_18600 [Bryobacteraceae bacterium]|nr:hypothetical protein [Bryobacteraceae bacterium]
MPEAITYEPELALERVARESREAVARARAIAAGIYDLEFMEGVILKGIRAARKRVAERGGFEPPVEL